MINKETLKEWYSVLKQYSKEIFAKALSRHGKFRMNNLLEIQEECKFLLQEIILEENSKIKPESLDDEDKEWARNFYKRYCDSEEEYYKKIKILEE